MKQARHYRSTAVLIAGLAVGAAATAAPVIEEVVVTATKREANVQDIPVAVTAIDELQLQRAGVQDLRDLPILSPSFNMNSSQTESQGSTFRLRGVGTTGNNIGLESAVGVFLDGVYLSRPGVALGDLFDVETIEVLRGPQGTLFGRNTTAGALSVQTKKPVLDGREFWADATAGNFDGYQVRAGGSLPLVEDRLGVRLAGSWREQDGFARSLTSGAESMNRDRVSLRGQLLWLPREDMELRVIADYADADEDCCDAAIIQETSLVDAGAFAAAGIPGGAGVVASGTRAESRRQTNADPFANPFDQWGVSVEWNWDLPWATLTYLGAFRDFEAESVQDSDFVALDVFSVRPEEANGFVSFDEIETWTHELRLQGVAGRLDWLVGGYYLDEEIVEQQGLGLGTDFGRNTSAVGWFGALLPTLDATVGLGNLSDLPLATGGTFGDVIASDNPAVVFAGNADPAEAFAQNRFTQEAESWSVFTHNTLRVTDRLDLVAGLRWTNEEKDGRFDQLAASSQACANTLSNTGSLLGAGIPATLAGLPAALMCFPFATETGLGPTTPVEFDQKFGDEELIWTVQGVYELAPEINGYVSFTHGFKAGGFNLDATAASGGADPTFDSETVDAWELGLKSRLFEGRVQANLALFHMDLEDFQVLEFTGVQFVTFNVPSAESYGLELETVSRVTEHLTLNAGWTFSEAEYPDDCAPDSDPAQVTALCGQDLTNAPEHVVVLAVDYDRPLGATGLNGFVNGSLRWEDDRRTSTQAVEISTGEPLPFDVQDDNAKVNLRLGIERQDGLWSAELWASNLFDVQTRNVTFNTPLRGIGAFGTGSRGVFFDAPRTYGLTLRTRL